MMLRVLVVDDERLIADSLAEILRFEGFECRTAYDGHGALAAAEEFSPDVLITDISMPGMDGWQVIREYGRVLPSCRVFLFSGRGDFEDVRERARALDSICEVYGKPVSPSILVDRLREGSQPGS